MQNHDDDLEFDDDFLGDDLEDDVALEDFDDDFLENEDWDDSNFGQEGDEMASPDAISSSVPAKKFSLSFNTIVIGGAVILGIIVLSFQVMKGQKKASVQNTRFVSSLGMEGTAENIAEEPDVSSNPDNLKENEEIGGGFLNDETNTLPGDLYMEEQDVPELPMPTPVSEEVERGESIADSLQFLTETHDEIPIEPVVEENPVIIPVTPDVHISQNEEIIDVVDEEKEVSPSVSNASLEAIDVKMDLFLDRMDGLEDKINEIDNAQSERSLALEQSVKNLQDRVKNISKPSVSSAGVVKRVVKKSASAPVSRRIQWQLKAAQPGKAWIAKKGQAAIKPVQIGENVDGIGTIQDIRLISNRWVVVGSKGKIQQ